MRKQGVSSLEAIRLQNAITFDLCRNVASDHDRNHAKSNVLTPINSTINTTPINSTINSTINGKTKTKPIPFKVSQIIPNDTHKSLEHGKNKSNIQPKSKTHL
jgi:hypothetical protein